MELSKLGQFGIVWLCGGLGAAARFGVNEICRQFVLLWAPLATLIVNAVGCFAAGMVMYATIDKPVMSHGMRLAVLTGLMGGMTTFSGFGYDCIALAREGRVWLASANVAANCVIGLSAVVVGRLVARAILG